MLFILHPSVAFTLVDIDGDGTVSRHDLVRYLELITAAPEGVKVDLVSQGEHFFPRVVIGLTHDAPALACLALARKKWRQ